jgi:hypothetical protein
MPIAGDPASLRRPRSLIFGPMWKRLLAQPSSRLLPIDRVRFGVGLCAQSRSAWRSEHTGATRLAEQPAGLLVACSGAVEQPHGDVDAEAVEIRGTFSQPC